MIAPRLSLCFVVPELMVMRGIFFAVTACMGFFKTSKSAMLQMTPL